MMLQPCETATTEQLQKNSHLFLGTWKLVSITRHTIPQTVVTEPYGSELTGYINYAADGRMMVIIIENDRPTPQIEPISATDIKTLFDTLCSYAGTYTIHPDYVIHHVDISWNQSWTGTDLTRYYQLTANNRLILTVPAFLDPKSGKHVIDSYTWEKISNPEK